MYYKHGSISRDHVQSRVKTNQFKRRSNQENLRMNIDLQCIRSGDKHQFKQQMNRSKVEMGTDYLKMDKTLTATQKERESTNSHKQPSNCTQSLKS